MVDVPREREVVDDVGFDAQFASDRKVRGERARPVGEGEIQLGGYAQNVGPVAVTVRHKGDARSGVDPAEIVGEGKIGVRHDDAPIASGTKMVACLSDRSVQPWRVRPKRHGPAFVSPDFDLRVVVDDEYVEGPGRGEHGAGHRADQPSSRCRVVARREAQLALCQRTKRDHDSCRTEITNIRVRKAHGSSLGFGHMRSLRQLLGRIERGEAERSDAPADAAGRTATWNTLYTIGAGAVADVDASGAVHPRHRPVSVEVWFGSGDRWVRGTADAGVRQTRVVGLPIIETRQRLGDGDVVQTAWADEPGDARGRVVIELKNETEVPVAAAVVVRPRRVTGERGSISEIRVAGSLIVADRRPLVDLTRRPGDVAVAIDQGSALLDLLAATGESLLGHESLEDDAARASLAAMIPLTPGVDRQILVVDGRQETTVAPAPLDRVVAGWRAHLDRAAEIELPTWPKHMPPALLSSLLGAVADGRAPLGADTWQRVDDAALAVALSRFGVSWAAAAVTERLLVAVMDGSLRRSDWPSVAAACALIVGSVPGDEALARYADAAVAVAGEALTNASTSELDGLLVQVVRVAHGDGAASDALSIVGKPPSGSALEQLERLRVGPTAGPWMPMNVVAVRAEAGTTWRWGRNGCGDSPHARADLLIGLRAMCLDTSGDSIDVLPGMTRSWRGQNLRVARFPTPAGRLSYALRWHGPRAALLWEIEGDSAIPVQLTCRAIDPSFETSDRTGEALLAEPTHLVDA